MVTTSSSPTTAGSRGSGRSGSVRSTGRSLSSNGTAWSPAWSRARDLAAKFTRLTDLERWLSEPEEPQPQLQAVLFQKVVLALESGRPAEAYLDAQRQAHLAVMRDLTTTRRTASLRESMRIDYQLFHIEADLRWTDHAAGRLDHFRRRSL